MYEYKTEILYTETKWTTGKASLEDVKELNFLFNKRPTKVWELVPYSYMATTFQIKDATLIAFRRKNRY